VGRANSEPHLPIKPAEHCRGDLVSLGEVMIRRDPGDRRGSATPPFDASQAEASTPGDTTMATLKELLQAMRGKGARIVR
jgi:hypothetical protein